MTSVRYGVTATGGWGARWIRLATHSKVNHAFIVNGDDIVIEGRPGGLGTTTLAAYPGAELSDPIEGPQADTVWNWTIAHEGTPYGWLDILALTLLCARIPTPKWAIRRLTSSKTLICSQAVAEAYAAAGIKLGTKRPALTTPGDLWDYLHGEPEPADW